MKQIANKIYDEERALYHLEDAFILNCHFEGPKDGESAFKEARRITVQDCYFALRYPFWHAHNFKIIKSHMTETCRAPLWYAENGEIVDCTINGVKVLRETNNVSITNSKVISTEFGWRCHNIEISNSELTSEYFLFESSDIRINHIKMKGKYSFQYVTNMTIDDSELDTKDAFWHTKNVTVRNSTIKGEYLGWYSDGLTLINCKIIGTQPLCYCKNLRLINCTMGKCDLSFEYSDVDADIIGHIDSVKNIKSGTVKADSVGEIINVDPVIECTGQVIIR